MVESRAGVTIRQKEGYLVFIPKPLPPHPYLDLNDSLLSLLSQADRALARLDGITYALPSPDLFLRMYIRKEALLSTQIEGTQATLKGVLAYEADLTSSDDPKEIKEVINYISAMEQGLNRISEVDISLILSLHKILITGTRGASKKPGFLREIQNYIGPPGSTIFEAVFVPPPPEKVGSLLRDLLIFWKNDDSIPPLIKASLIHAQFETIHPFLDGNGRLGRLLITLFLCEKKVLHKPLLYLSLYLKRNQDLYYQLLNEVRYEGAWELWIHFFLQGIQEISEEALITAQEIISLKEKVIDQLLIGEKTSLLTIKLTDLLFKSPIITAPQIQESLHTNRQTAYDMIHTFEQFGIISEITGKKRYKKYLFREYIEIIEKGWA
jgi:Fic family protein